MKFILGALGVIFLVILVIVLITRGGNDRTAVEEAVVISEQAREGVSAVYTQQGAVVGQNQRRAIRIIVNQDERRLEILTGYEEAVLRSHTYANTNAAYQTFLVAIDQAGFGTKKATTVVDPRGACPLGRTYIFELREFSQPMIDLWSTSCGKKMGTFGGNTTMVRTLFEKQIPDYAKRVQDVDLSGTKSPEAES